MSSVAGHLQNNHAILLKVLTRDHASFPASWKRGVDLSHRHTSTQTTAWEPHHEHDGGAISEGVKVPQGLAILHVLANVNELLVLGFYCGLHSY